MSTRTRHDGRRPDQLREIEIIRGFTQAAPGSVLFRQGRTRVLCTATIEEAVPAWREASGAGWLTAEYDMLPGSTAQRRPRTRAKVDGRAAEIQRLIGRALRGVVDLPRLGQRTLYLDCDVLEADGGTRTAAVSGAYVALCDALAEGRRRGLWGDDVLRAGVAAVSVGLVADDLLLDLDYSEDSAAAVDCNLVMTTRGAWVEVQATAERAPFTEDDLTRVLALGRRGLEQLFAAQQAALARPPTRGA
ncbi:MAG: ribonuclease PH [Planctomycetota bacterium]